MREGGYPAWVGWGRGEGGGGSLIQGTHPSGRPGTHLARLLLLSRVGQPRVVRHAKIVQLRMALGRDDQENESVQLKLTRLTILQSWMSCSPCAWLSSVSSRTGNLIKSFLFTSYLLRKTAHVMTRVPLTLYAPTTSRPVLSLQISHASHVSSPFTLPMCITWLVTQRNRKLVIPPQITLVT